MKKTLLLFVAGLFMSLAAFAVAPVTGTMHVCVGSSTTLADTTSGGYWTSSATGTATVVSTSGAVTGVAAGVAVISYHSSSGIAVASVTVNPVPAAIGGTTTVAVGSSITMTDATSGGYWAVGGSGIATIGTSTGIVTGVSAGTTGVYYVLPTGCGAYTSVTVTGSSSLHSITGTTHTCVGSYSILADSTSGGTWSSSNTSIATVTTGGAVVGVSAGTVTITYTVGTAITTTSFTVYAVPAAITGAGTEAVGSSITLADASSGGAWISGNTSIATVTSGGVVTGVATGVVNIYYEFTTGCAVYHTDTVTGSTSVSPITGTMHVCVGSTITLADATSGGYWTSSSTSIATIVSTSGVLTGVSAGVASISYHSSAGIAVASVTVNPVPAAISGSTTVAVGSSVTLTDATSGGYWADGSSGIATIGTSTGIVTGVSAGTTGVYYVLPTGCGAYVIMTVTGSSTLHSITGTTHTCVGSYSILSDSTSGGTWSSSNTSIATVTTGGAVVGVSAGTVTISYTVGSSVTTTSFTVYAVPASITGAGTEAVGSSITLADASSGGAWISGNTSIATVTSGGVVTGVATGVVNIYYEFTTGCAVYHTDTVTGSTSTIHHITGTMHTCVGSYSILADSTSGGTWSSSNTAIATVTTGGAVVGVSAGTVTISYTVGSSVTTTSFTVYAVPAAITGAGTEAVGSSITLADASSGGAWISGNTSIATVGSTGIVTGVATGVVNIYYEFTTGCAVYHTDTVTGGSTSVLPITGTMHVCVGATVTLADATTGGYWTSSSTSIATIVSTSGVLTGVSAGVASISYHSSACIAVASVTVNPAPAAITGTTTVAVGSSTTLSDATSGGHWADGSSTIATIGSATGVATGVSAGTTGVYYILPTGCATYTILTVTGSSTIHSITGTTHTCVGSYSILADSTSGGTWSSSNTSIATVTTGGAVVGVSAGTVTITYTVGTAITTTSFTVYALPAAITGAGTEAVGSSITLADASSGGAWISGNTSIATVGSTGIVTGVATGVVNIYYEFTTGCAVYHTDTVTGSTSVHSISGTTHVCSGYTTTLSDSTTGGHWSSSATSIATVGSSTGVVTGVSSGVVTITYALGTSIATASVTVFPTPAAISGSSSICTGTTTTLSDGTTGGYWISGSTSVATIGSSTGVVTAVTTGTTNIYYVIGGCASYKTVSVVTMPSVSASSASTCGSNFTLSASGATYYSWAPSTGLSCTSCSSTTASISSSVTYTVTGYNGTGCYAHATVTPDMNRIYGYVTFSGATPDSLAMVVWLIKFNPIDSTLSMMDSTYTCLVSAGTPWFMFHDEPSGSYLVKGKMVNEVPGTSGYVPTYAAATTHWYSASSITHGTGSDYAHITMQYGTVPTGPGFISGYISAGAGRGTSGDVPVAGMLVFLQDMSGNVLSQAYTDATGAYSFTGIADGSYVVYPEAYDFYTTSSVITLNAANESVTGVDFKQHTTNGTITPVTATAIQNVATQGFNIYPNPSTGNIFIQWSNKTTGNADVTISDITGRVVYTSAINISAASGQSQLNVDDLKNGVYLIAIKGAGMNYNGKVMIQH